MNGKRERERKRNRFEKESSRYSNNLSKGKKRNCLIISTEANSGNNSIVFLSFLKCAIYNKQRRRKNERKWQDRNVK